MKQSLTLDCLRFIVFDFNTSQALLCFLSVMYSSNFSLFHRDKILNPIQAGGLTLFKFWYFVIIQGVPRICQNPAHTKPLFGIHLLDVQGVRT